MIEVEKKMDVEQVHLLMDQLVIISDAISLLLGVGAIENNNEKEYINM